MKDLLKFEVVVYLRGDRETNDILNDLELNYQDTEDITVDRIVSYSFEPDDIIEIRETFVKYNGEWREAVMCSFLRGNYNYQTPPLLTTYEELKTQLDEYNKKKLKA